MFVQSTENETLLFSFNLPHSNAGASALKPVAELRKSLLYQSFMRPGARL
jgi:hypothetical protein